MCFNGSRERPAEVRVRLRPLHMMDRRKAEGIGRKGSGADGAGQATKVLVDKHV